MTRIMDRARFILCFALYRYGAAQIPSQLRRFRKLRVMLLRGMGVDVAWTANINAHASIHPSCTIAEHAGVGEGSLLSGEVHLGPHVTMGPGCWFITGDHPVPADGEYFRDHASTRAPIVVEEDVFIGARAIILGGVTIGRGAAVGAGAVVARDVAPGAVVVGNPAREVKRRQPPPSKLEA